MFRRTASGGQRKQFFIDGRKVGLSPEEYGIMAVELSLVPARNMVESALNLTHDKDDTSLIHQISQNPNFAIANFLAIGAAAFVAYTAIGMEIPEEIKPDIGVGVKRGVERLGGNTDLIYGLFATYLPLLYRDIKMGGPSHPAGTETHRKLVKILSQQYSGREDLEDFEGMDSITLAPFTDNYYLSIMTLLRDTARVRFAFG
jgi:hypothetical protein